MIKTKSKIPFDFILDELSNLDPVVKPMFGCHAIYVGPKIMVIMRNKEDHKEDNGVWVATFPEHHQSIRKDFPEMRSIKLFGEGESAWQNIPADTDDFESSVMKLCKLISLGDERIGKIPKPKKKKISRQARNDK